MRDMGHLTVTSESGVRESRRNPRFRRLNTGYEPSGASQDRSIGWPVVGSVLIILVGAVLLMPGLPPTIWLASVNGTIALSAIVLAGSSGRLDRTSPIVWMNIAFVVMFTAHPIAMVLTGVVNEVYHGKYDVRPGYDLALSIAMCGILSFNVGYGLCIALVHRGRPLVSTLASQPGMEQLRRGKLAATWSNFLLLLALVLYVAYALSIGSDPITAIFGGARRDDGLSSTAYLYFAPQLIGPATILRLYSMLILHKGRVILGLLVVVQLLLFVPGGQRLVLLLTLVPTAIAAYSLRGRSMRALSVIAIAALALIGVISLRDVGAEGQGSFFDTIAGTWSSPSVGINEFLTGADTEMVDGLSVEVQTVPSILPFEPGSVLRGAIAAPIPSAIWPAKPVTMDSIINGYLLGTARNNAGVAYSFIGELYFDSSWLSIGIGMAVFGVLAGLSFSRLRTRRDSVWLLVYATLLPSYVALARGVLAYSLGRALFTVVPVLLFAMVVEWRHRVKSW